jgi:hypothetical protein
MASGGIAGLRVLIAVRAAVSSISCSSASDEECIRRYLNEAREKWCFAERTMNDEAYEPLEPLRRRVDPADPIDRCAIEGQVQS